MKIYGIKDNRTNKIIYIGQTIQAGKKRFYDHFRASYNDQKTDRFHLFLKTRSIQDFEFVVLEDNIEDKQILNQREKFYIELYDTINNGFNSYSQSNITNLHQQGKKIKWFNNDKKFVRTFNSIVEAEYFTGVNCSNISHCCNHLQTKTSAGWFRFDSDDSPLEESYRPGLSMAVQKLDPFTLEVLCTYPSLQQAEQTEGITGGYLSAVCQGKRYSAKGFIYQYEDKSKQVAYQGKGNIKTGIAQIDKETRKVLARFLTCEDCATILNLNKDTILRARNAFPKISLGYMWVRADKYKELLMKGEIFEDEFTKIYY